MIVYHYQLASERQASIWLEDPDPKYDVPPDMMILLLLLLLLIILEWYPPGRGRKGRPIIRGCKK